MSILIYFATIFWSLFPNLIHVFQGGDNFINKVNANNLVVNGDFSDGIGTWSNSYNASLSIEDNALKVIKSVAENISTFRQPNELNITSNDLFYYSIDIKTTYSFVYFRLVSYDLENNIFIQSSNYNIVSTDFTNISHIGSFQSNINTNYLGLSIYINSDIDTFYFIDNIKVYNVTQMITNGVKNDSGILFSDLSDLEIKEQLDIWITEYSSLNFIVTKDNTTDQWFDTGFVEKTAERDFLDYLGYFVWLFTPPIILFATLNLLRRVI